MEQNTKLDRQLLIPIHQQLYQYIKECIDQGIYKRNEVIPSEKELQEQFHISRITVRRAISDLEHDGYLKKRRGKGTIVLEKRVERPLNIFQSFSGAAKVNGEHPASIILSLEKRKANIKVAQMLQLDVDEPVTYLKRLRLLDGKVIALHETYITSRISFEVKEDDFDSTTSLYEYLEAKGIHLGCADEVLEVRCATPQLQKELFIQENKPIMYKELVTYDDQGNPVEYSENNYIGDSFQYSIHIENAKERGDH